MYIFAGMERFSLVWHFYIAAKHFLNNLERHKKERSCMICLLNKLYNTK